MRGLSVVGLVAGALALSPGLAGCGEDTPSGGHDPVDLTRRLAPDAGEYVVADLARLRADLGLPEDADPLGVQSAAEEFSGLGMRPLAGLLAALPSRDVTAALDLGAARAAAYSSSGRDGVTALATDADTGDVGSDLGDLGYEDMGGILEQKGEPNLRLEAGLIFASGDPALLRDLPKDPLDELPAPLLGEVDGDVILYRSPGVGRCTNVAASTDAEGDGELVIEVDGGAEIDNLELDQGGGVRFGEPKVDGEIITVPVSSTRGGFAAEVATFGLLVSYDCG